MCKAKVWYKSPAMIAFGVTIGLGIIGVMVPQDDKHAGAKGGGGGAAVAATPKANQQAQQEPDNITTVEYGPKKKKVKAAVLDGTYHIIARVDHQKAIGNEFESTRADGEFVILRMQVANGTDSTRTISTSGMKLIDKQGRHFAQSAEGQTALVMSGDPTAEFLMSEIQPGLTKNISVVFDVPPASKDLKLQISSGSLLGGSALLAVRNP